MIKKEFLEGKSKKKNGKINLVLDPKNKTRLSKCWNKEAEIDEVKSATALSREKNKSIFEIPYFLDRSKIENKSVLDFGCGYGRNLVAMIDFNPKFLVGIDLSSVMLTKCFYNLTKKKPKQNVVLIETELKSNPIENNSFDLIYTNAVLLHNSKKEVKIILENLLKLLKKEGRIYITGSFLNKYNPNNFQYFLYNSLRTLLIGRGANTVSFYSRKELINIINSLKDSNCIIRPKGAEIFVEEVLGKRLPFFSLIKRANKFIAEKIFNLRFSLIFCRHYEIIIDKL